MNKRIYLSLSVIMAVAAVVVGATTAFYNDTEVSTGNTFTAGSLDLKVDSQCHYYHYIPGHELADDNGYVDVGCNDRPDGEGEYVVGTWAETDLEDGVHKFFWFNDIKPGDWGEDTISLHVYDNDAWGRVLMNLTEDFDNTCTEPEEESTDSCTQANPENQTAGSGELLETMAFSMWLDQGNVPGFQCNNGVVNQPACQADPAEGDNVWQGQEVEPVLPVQGELEFDGVLSAARNNQLCANTPANGHNQYGVCHGLAADGRMVASTTYYLGLRWELPAESGNETQSDSLGGDVVFEIEQHRNNPNPFVSPVVNP